MATVDLILQGKGGVGKSYIASLLAQHYRARNLTPICIDTDPVNQTFSGYRAYGVDLIRLTDSSNDINPRAFDDAHRAHSGYGR